MQFRCRTCLCSDATPTDRRNHEIERETRRQEAVRAKPYQVILVGDVGDATVPNRDATYLFDRPVTLDEQEISLDKACPP